MLVIMKTLSPFSSGPMASNIDAIRQNCLYRKSRPVRIPKSNLPSPKSTAARMEIAMLKADLARRDWILRRIATIESKLGLAGH